VIHIACHYRRTTIPSTSTNRHVVLLPAIFISSHSALLSPSHLDSRYLPRNICLAVTCEVRCWLGPSRGVLVAVVAGLRRPQYFLRPPAHDFQHSRETEGSWDVFDVWSGDGEHGRVCDDEVWGSGKEMGKIFGRERLIPLIRILQGHFVPATVFGAFGAWLVFGME
jgi:hypothetical protein